MSLSAEQTSLICPCNDLESQTILKSSINEGTNSMIER
jgi:hypothetical protein